MFHIYIYIISVFSQIFWHFLVGGETNKAEMAHVFFRFAAVKLMRQLMCPFQELANTAWAFAKLLGFTKFEVCYAV